MRSHLAVVASRRNLLLTITLSQAPEQPLVKDELFSIANCASALAYGPSPVLLESTTIEMALNTVLGHSPLSNPPDTLPPIQRLPDEILQEVFLLCIPKLPQRVTFSPVGAPILLTHVCHRWRESAHHLPSLWTSLDLEILLRPDREPNEGSVTNWFSRSKNLPFKFKLSFDDTVSRQIRIMEHFLTLCDAMMACKDDGLPGGGSREAIDADKRELTQRRSTLQALPVPQPLPSLTGNLLTPIQFTLVDLTLLRIPLVQLQTLGMGSFPSLLQLTLALTVGSELKDVDITPSIPPLLCFTGSPHLRSVAATRLPPGDHLKLPWEQLTHFAEFQCYPDPTWHFLYTHIHAAVKLTHLHVSLDEFQARHSCNVPGWQAGRWLIPFSPVVLPALRKLSIYCPRNYSRTMQSDFWSRFDFPNIEALQIARYNVNMGDGSSWGPNEIDAFTRKFRGWTKLTHLSLRDTYHMPGETFKVLLNAMPRLTILDLAPNHECLRTLALDEDADSSAEPTSQLVPNLRHLVLQIDHTVEYKGNLIWDVLEVIDTRTEVRRQGHDGEGLQKVTIYTSDLSAAWVEDFKEGTSDENMEVHMDVEFKKKRGELYSGWQSWSDMDDELSSWAGVEEVAIRDRY
ncbi:hypothetical protein NMY22_g8317 [Coprinellus aureogranulatus]|nr:hypothetical protein NMY22_g8317 [Coprinellus aureogranulatus]